MKPELAKVGPAWEGGNLERWPGVAGVAGQTNYLAQNINPFLPDPVDSSSVRDLVTKGGKRRPAKKSKRHAKKSKRTRRKRIKGGSKHGTTLLPQSLVNLGRTTEYNVQGFWSDFTGSQGPVNPDPSVQPIGK